MIIDCHTHVNWNGWNAERIVGHMDAIGVDQACLLTWENVDGLSNHYIHLAYARVREACAAYPDRFLPWYAPDPRRPDAEQVLRAAIRKGLKGFGECKVRVCINNPDLVKLFRIAGDAGLPVLFHMDKAIPPDYAYWYNHDIDALAGVLEMLPHVNFVGHGPGFWRHVSGDEDHDTSSYPKGRVTSGGKLLKLLKRYRNLYCDLSAGSGLNAISRDRAWGRRFLLQHSNRILYGTDQFKRDHLDYLEGLNLDGGVMRRIMGGNAVKLVRK